MDGAGSPTQPSGFLITPLLICLTGILITTLAIVGYHLMVVRFCMTRRQRRASNGSQTSPNGHIATGVEEKILNAIPIMAYSSKEGNLFRVDQSECVICLGELEDGDMVRLLPNCAHAFHVPCIDQWFLAHTSCPICRSPVVAPFESVIALPIEDEGELRDQNLRQLHGHDGGGGDCGCDINASTSQVPSCGLLRHSVSLVLPMEWKSRRLVMGLKRSLSMDQSHVLINIQREAEKGSSSSSSSSKGILMESRSYRARSMRQLDHVSSRFLRSLSQLRMSRISSAANETLPR